MKAKDAIMWLLDFSKKELVTDFGLFLEMMESKAPDLAPEVPYIDACCPDEEAYDELSDELKDRFDIYADVCCPEDDIDLQGSVVDGRMKAIKENLSTIKANMDILGLEYSTFFDDKDHE